jgi:pimeloyl-ACP methyl ester carboxylesterase
MKMPIASGSRVEYDDVGQGKPVVLLHAFPLARTMWRPQTAALQNTNRLIVPDLPGFGGSDGFAATPSIEGMADAVAGLLDALRVGEPVVLGGLSMGGYVALAFARKYPTRLRGLLLADTRAEADSAEGKANRDKLIAFAQGHTAQDVLEQILPKMVSEETRSRRREIVTEVRRLAAAQTVEGVIGALRAMRDRHDGSAWLESIAVPTLVIVGGEDAITPPDVARKLADSIRGARLEVMNGAGHLSNLEQPGAFTVAVGAFLENVP